MMRHFIGGDRYGRLYFVLQNYVGVKFLGIGQLLARCIRVSFRPLHRVKVG